MEKLCRTDCVKIENVKEDATEDMIKLGCTNKSLVKGEVTRVLRCNVNKRVAYVYFKNYQGMILYSVFVYMNQASCLYLLHNHRKKFRSEV